VKPPAWGTSPGSAPPLALEVSLLLLEMLVCKNSPSDQMNTVMPTFAPDAAARANQESQRYRQRKTAVTITVEAHATLIYTNHPIRPRRIPVRRLR